MGKVLHPTTMSSDIELKLMELASRGDMAALEMLKQLRASSAPTAFVGGSPITASGSYTVTTGPGVASSLPTVPTSIAAHAPKIKKPDELKVGDRVRVTNPSGVGFCNHHELTVGKEGIVCRIMGGPVGSRGISVSFEGFKTGHNCGGYADQYYGPNSGRDGNESEVKKIKMKKKNLLNLKKLDDLVIKDEAKSEIVAVLKQHKHADKLFKTWGLGSVIEYGKGMTFLFYGPPGTGKTWAAHCIAKATGKELLVVGAADIQTSEPGGANRNIIQAFDEAKKKKKILFIDECDSLITSRNDVGMVLGSEINTLLTEIEKFEDVVILATNRVEHLDAALERRIALIVEFPEPTFELREGIWKRMLPKKMPLGEVSAKKLAEHKLTGGQIKNVVLQAARLALAADSRKVEWAHFEQAISRVHKSKNLVGTASTYQQMIKVTSAIDKIKGDDIDIDEDIHKHGN